MALAKVPVDLALNDTLDSGKGIPDDAVMTRAIPQDLVVVGFIPTRLALESRAVSQARSQRRIARPFRQEERVPSPLHLEPLRQSSRVGEHVEELAQIARVGDEVGRGEQVEWLLRSSCCCCCCLEGPEERLKGVRVPRETGRLLQGRIVPVESYG